MTINRLLLTTALLMTAGPASAQLTFDFLKIAEAGDTPLGFPGPLTGSFPSSTCGSTVAAGRFTAWGSSPNRHRLCC